MAGALQSKMFAESRDHLQKKYVSPHGIRVHQETENPGRAFNKLCVNREVKKTRIMQPEVPITPDKVRIVCISDTHCKTSQLEIPNGDILVHAGDFTARGRIEEVQAFARFMEKQPHKHKVVIAGNHELSFGYFDGFCDPLTLQRLLGPTCAATFKQQMKDLNISHPKELLPKDVIYLNNSAATVCGLKMWGSPWTPFFHGWAYNARRGEEILQIWDAIPGDTDVLITHGPPVGIGDTAIPAGRVGCVELYTTVRERVKPQLHVFGHIHEAYGLYTDGTTLYANAAICNIRYRPTNAPICIDLMLPEGASKDDVLIETETVVSPISRQFPEDFSPTYTQATREAMQGVLAGIKRM